jgi:hypothetical protein
MSGAAVVEIAQIDSVLPHLYIETMCRTLLGAILLALLVAGCSTQPEWQPEKEQDLFAPTAMRIHPVFTQVRDWTNDGKPDGIDVLIEFQDRFGDPAKAAGNAVFEVFAYRPGFPDPRGPRMVAPFLASIDNVAAQRDHWNRTSRCYSFQLAWPEINPGGTYVLTANFELAGGGRFNDQLVLVPQAKENPREPASPTTGPAAEPGLPSTAPANELPATGPASQPAVSATQP